MCDGYNATWTDQSATFRYICDGFSSLRDLDSLHLNTQARISLRLQYATGNLRDIMPAWLVWGKVLTAVAQGMRYTGVEPEILVEGGAWRGQGVDYRPQVRRFVSTDAGDVTQLSQPSFEPLADASALRCPCNLRYPCNTMVLRLTVSETQKRTIKKDPKTINNRGRANKITESVGFLGLGIEYTVSHFLAPNLHIFRPITPLLPQNDFAEIYRSTF